jgi:hypothetical protein
MPTFTGYAARCGRAPGPSINQSINQSSRTHLISALTRGEAPAHPLNPVPVQSRSSRSRQNEEGVIQYWRAPHLTPSAIGSPPATHPQPRPLRQQQTATCMQPNRIRQAGPYQRRTKEGSDDAPRLAGHDYGREGEGRT